MEIKAVLKGAKQTNWNSEKGGKCYHNGMLECICWQRENVGE